MNKELTINTPWKPGVNHLNTFEAVHFAGLIQTKSLCGENTQLANESVKAADLAILKMLNIW